MIVCITIYQYLILGIRGFCKKNLKNTKINMILCLASIPMLHNTEREMRGFDRGWGGFSLLGMIHTQCDDGVIGVLKDIQVFSF